MSNHEELYNGTFAHDFINNPKLFFLHPNLLFSYQYMPFAGGTLVVSLLAVPFFLIFGGSVFSLKLLSLFISLASLIVLFILIEKFFSLKAALIFGLLYIISPPYPVIISLILWGNHIESILFSALLLFFMFRYWTVEQSDNYKHLIFSGIIAGFGIYFDYIFLITIIAILAFQLLYDRHFFIKKDLLLFSMSIVIGLIPWFYSTIFFNLGNLTIHRGLKADLSLNYLIKKFLRLVFLDIPNFFWIKELYFFSINIFSNIYYLIFLISFLYFLFFSIKNYLNYKFLPKEFLFVIYLIVFSIIFTLSKFTTSDTMVGLNLNIHPFKIYRYRFLIPLYPFITILISLFLAKLRQKLIFLLITAILIIISLSSYLDYLSLESIGECFIYKGYSYSILSNRLSNNYNLKDCTEIINNLPKEYHPKLYKGLGNSFARTKGIFILNEKTPYFIDTNYKASFYEGVGNGLMEKYKNLKDCLKMVEKFDNDKIDYIHLGIMEFSLLFNDVKDITESMKSQRERHSGYLYKAMGKGAYILLGIDYINEFKLKVKDNYNILIPFYIGVGEAIGEHILDRQQMLLKKEEIPSIFHEEYDRALSKIINANNILNKIDKNVLSYVREGLVKNLKSQP